MHILASVALLAPVLAAAIAGLGVMVQALAWFGVCMLIEIERFLVRKLAGRHMFEQFITPETYARCLTAGTLVIWLACACGRVCQLGPGGVEIAAFMLFPAGVFILFGIFGYIDFIKSSESTLAPAVAAEPKRSTRSAR